MSQTFRKSERLCSKIKIETLFEKGSTFLSYPFHITRLTDDENDGPPVQVLIVVSKRRIKSAVDRNRIKRIIREVYRRNKHIIQDKYDTISSPRLLLCLSYIGKTNVKYRDVERKLILILQRLSEKDG